MKKKKTIKERVYGEIFDDWDDKVNRGIYVARDKLKKMFMVDYPLLKDEDIEDKRLILHNLTVVEKEIGQEKGLRIYNNDSIRFYSSLLKDEMDKIEGYKEGENACLYVRVLVNYIESHKKILSKQEIIDYYTYCYDIYEKFEDKKENGYLSKLIIKFNLNLAKENFDVLLKIIEELIHNSDDLEYKRALDELIMDVQEVNSLLYEKISLLFKQKQRNNKLIAL